LESGRGVLLGGVETEDDGVLIWEEEGDLVEREPEEH
jgi:hypothetical protein